LPLLPARALRDGGGCCTGSRQRQRRTRLQNLRARRAATAGNTAARARGNAAAAPAWLASRGEQTGQCERRTAGFALFFAYATCARQPPAAPRRRWCLPYMPACLSRYAPVPFLHRMACADCGIYGFLPPLHRCNARFSRSRRWDAWRLRRYYLGTGLRWVGRRFPTTVICICGDCANSSRVART